MTGHLSDSGVIPELITCAVLYSTCKQNLATLASAVPEIWLQYRNRKWAMWPWSRPFKGWFVILARIWYSVLYAKFDDSSISRSRDIIEALKFKVGHVTLTTSLLKVICHQYARTWHSLCTKIDQSTVPEIWLVPTKILIVQWPYHAPLRDYLSFISQYLLRSTYVLNLKYPSLPITKKYKSDTKHRKWGCLGNLGVNQGHWK